MMQECCILGVNVAVTNLTETVEFLQNNVKNLRGKYICVSNVHTIITAYEDEKYLAVQNSAALRLPDGKPLSKAQQKRGFKDAQRVTGPTLMEEILKISILKNYRHVFYGATEDTLNKIRKKLNIMYPEITENFMYYSPAFMNKAKKESGEVINKINAFEPDFIWVGLGAPKQEEWMSLNHRDLNAVCIGVGAAFDYFADNIKRAPKWMQEISLEWLYRLFQNPKLLKRYWHTNKKYLKLIKKENKNYKKS